MSYRTWQDYWIKNGYVETVGKIITPSGSRLTHGSFSPRELFDPAGPHRRYGLNINAAPVWNEAGNVDPSVLEEWAAAHDVKIETPAGATEQQDLKYVADGNGDTWYGDVLRPWTIAREAGGEVTKPTEALGVISNQVAEAHGAVDDAIKRIDAVEEAVITLHKETTSRLDALSRFEQGLDARMSGLASDMKQIKALLQRLVPGKAAKS